ncbi:unnamed protein product [Parajaminaea phylloscopi]
MTNANRSQSSLGSSKGSTHSPSERGATSSYAATAVAPASNGHADAVRILAIDGADDEESPIVFSDPSASKLPLYELGKRRAPDAADYGIEIQGLVDDVPFFDSLSGDLLYTVRSDRDLKSFTIIPEQPSGNSMTTSHNVHLKPRKKLGTYKMEFESLDGTTTWAWKGSVFSSLELTHKNARGEKTSLAVFIRTSTGSHTLRLYPAIFASSPTDTTSLHSNPILALVIPTVYPFLAIYRRHLETDFTSERKVGQRSAGAIPSGWDSKVMGDMPKNPNPLRLANGGGGANAPASSTPSSGRATPAANAAAAASPRIDSSQPSTAPGTPVAATASQQLPAQPARASGHSSAPATTSDAAKPATKTSRRWNPLDMFRRS